MNEKIGNVWKSYFIDSFNTIIMDKVTFFAWNRINRSIFYYLSCCISFAISPHIGLYLGWLPRINSTYLIYEVIQMKYTGQVLMC